MVGLGSRARPPSPFLPGILAAALALTLAAPSGAAPARADRFGVYHWGADFSAWPGGPDRLTWGADKVAALGSRTIRVFLGAGDVYGVDPARNRDDADFLRRIARGPAYAALFADPRLRTYLLTVYPPGAFVAWRDGFDAEEAALEREQVARMGERLLADPAHAGKTFIVLNWEGDHATASLGRDDERWEDFTAWIRARAAGVVEARARVPRSRARLLSGLEFNFIEKPVEEEDGGSRRAVPCGRAEARCVIDTVAPRVEVDVYSYSAWQSVNVKLADPGADLALRLREDLAFALAAVRAARPRVRMADFVLGELGFARSLYGECAAARHLREALAAADSLGVAHAIVWQALDNRWRVEDGATRSLTSCRAPDWSLYGLFRGLDGGRTLLGATFSAWLTGRTAPVPAGCPSIRPAGVRDPGARGRGRLTPGGRVAVAGSGFSPAGNRLRLLQAHLVADDEPDVPNEHLTLHAAAARAWRESPQRIEAALPTGALHDGCALVYVTNAAGTDSNAVLVRVRGSRRGALPRQPQ